MNAPVQNMPIYQALAHAFQAEGVDHQFTGRVDRIDRDQASDYAARKGMTLAEIERWLSPNLGYDPKR